MESFVHENNRTIFLVVTTEEGSRMGIFSALVILLFLQQEKIFFIYI